MERPQMSSLYEYMDEYKNQLQKGAIQKAYKGLMDYYMGLRSHLSNTYPDYFVSGIYYGYMDMTYFSFFPDSLKHRNLKVAIVFLHEQFRFEVWLAAKNKRVQTEYWEMFKESDWHQYQVISTTKGMDSIVEHILVDDPDFRDLDHLTNQIEKDTLIFIENIEDFLSKHSS
jgi:hypothetical protein